MTECICNDGFGMNLSCPIHAPAVGERRIDREPAKAPSVPSAAAIEEALNVLSHAHLMLTCRARFVPANRVWGGEQFDGDVHGVRPEDWKEISAGLDRVYDLLRGAPAADALPAPSEALTRSRIDHWLRNRNLVMHHEGLGKSMGYSGTIEAILALLEDLHDYAAAVPGSPHTEDV